ncbi:MAG: hypothetical protein DI628_08475 [Blastochloris viridis]|uniref:Uncharacterized protein n=1 Tax=Blastochloris viridis TaxID=1079 RepID=A0A6N4RCV8_BLAVI|nr:MAG: hypothetical protein DI628_08475 [Blastochloris viridis]
MLRVMMQSLPLLSRLAKRLPVHVRGALAEKAALVSYLIRGFTPLTVSQHLAQTDLTLRRGNLILLVEVKYRTTRERGHLALTPAQKARLNRQARSVAARYPACTVRLEVCLLFPHWPFQQRIPLQDA